MNRRLAVRTALAASTAALAFAGAAPAAEAAFSVTAFDTSLLDPTASPSSNLLTAGGHPDVSVRLRFPKKIDPATQTPVSDENVRQVNADLPAGLAVNPEATATCLPSDFSAQTCPADSQVGTVKVFYPNNGSFPDNVESRKLYNLVTPPGVPARFGFSLVEVKTVLDARVRTGGDYGLSADIKSITQALPVTGAEVTLWGVPSDPVHDADRGGPSSLPRRTQVSNPTACGGARSFAASALSWQNPGNVFDVADVTEPDGSPYEFTDCAAVPFGPTASVKPTTTAPDSPTGLDLSVSVPQSDSPNTRATSHLRDLKLTLPPGMSVNPSAASGLTACKSGQIALSSPGSPSCPDSAAIGTASLSTPLLSEPLTGRVYLAAQNDNPFGSLLSLYLVVEGRGVVIKLAGKIDADPATGQLVATFRDNPQLPFSKLDVHLNDGQRAPLATPAVCGPQSATVDLTPWSGGAIRSQTTGFSIDCAGGLGAFAPSFAAGTESPTAGLSSPLFVNVDRPDGQSVLDRLSLRLPEGLLASLRGVRRCADAQADAGTCDALSRVGGVDALVGAGSDPYPVSGDVFLTGPYRGAPFGLAVRIRAIAGPLDLGIVVVRQALFIDPDDTHVDVVSDPLPTILQGIPIRLRSLRVNVDRRGFALNPTSCDEKRVRGNFGAVTGENASLAVRFQVGSCDALQLSPKLALRLGGSGSALRDGGHPSLKAILIQPSGQSNLKRAQVKLPLSLALDPNNAQTLCEYADGRKSVPTCPKGSIVGTAKARTPLLGKTLSGPVYFVKGQRADRKTGRVIKTLPTLVVPLTGDGVRINLRATTAVSNGQLVTTFDPIPDSPVSRFDLSLNGASQGILVANSSVCANSRALRIGIRGQNGELNRSTPTLAASCK